MSNDDKLDELQAQIAELRQKRPASTSPLNENSAQKKANLKSSSLGSSFEDTEESVTMEVLQRQMQDIMNEMQGIKQAIATQENNIVDRLHREMQGMRDEINSLKAKVDQKDILINNLEKRIEEIEKKRDDNENHNRLSNIRLNGIPEKEGESCEDIVVKVAEVIGATVRLGDIDRAHRTGKPKDGGPRSIICRFNNFRVRRMLTQEKKKLKEESIKKKTK